MSMRVFAVKPKLIIIFIIVVVVLLYLTFKSTYRPSSGPLSTIKLDAGSVGHGYATVVISTQDLEDRLRKGEKIDENSSKLAELIRFKYIAKAKPDRPYNLQDVQKKDFSRGQSMFIEETLGSKKNGFFIDIGAGDGEKDSVSLYLEKELRWTGLLIEPDPAKQQDLALKNRKADILHGCVNNEKFAMQKKIKEGHLFTDSASDQDQEGYPVMCFPFSAIATAIGRRHIDLVTIDANRRELEILETIPFNLIEIEILSVEFQEDEANDIIQFMRSQGYKAINLMDNRILDKRDLIFRRRSTNENSNV
ncbi:protein Star-like [Liolophura sinensis]|uniref:protein Star-like n=1 Tax=Liolophura sinensis TaxID=3198878 RepID=UPI003158429F